MAEKETQAWGIPDGKELKARHISEIGRLISGLDVLGLYEVARLIREYIQKREAN